ncbi:glycerol-3-phosphate 1-O-acyltransferase [Lachnoanaerobaculum orale]|jgi:acyl-phosphate glycerol 3-phosphate acyltransferase|uniref:Glycerol-3-phosphate acyltransferase n=1 Tax=Lachnoanaerobaculum orale TaxID=979627 RepID=A0A3P3Q5H1_9FIRM|nr:glycerol-3-phosphate 1-O-acyltransferase PlsY [Lachnoanaerobaculum orale]MDU5597160.1 glycerol-3-phosphate 1-O-acyltransferase PlsY [Lachnospiraceae bacterium]RRJ16365.1 glycerol-3-phosphate 1-O-acyltransferase [Lachnoanaerobaculum orale]
MLRILLLIIGYFIGNIETGYIFGKIHKMDIRNYGSGNAGATNTLRVLGAKAGLVVFLGDFCKSLIPCLVVRFIFRDNVSLSYIYMLYIGLGVVLGHNFPFYLGFKGGKGVASTAGIIMALDIRIAVVCLIVFIITVAITRYVSLGSIFVMIILIGMSHFLVKFSYGFGEGASPMEFRLLTAAVGLLSIFMHRANIKRLLGGTENKIGKKVEK